jgi:hypothetical protein
MMKRVLAGLAVLGLLAALPLMHAALAAPMDKALVCHIDEVDFTVDPITGDILVNSFTAHVIDVNGNSVPAHEGHGDVVLPAGSPLVKGDDCSAEPGLDPVLKALSELEEEMESLE